MTRADALKDALTKVEAETARSADFMAAFPQRHEHWDEDCAAHAQSAYLGSLDAAKALHEAVLPEYGWDIDSGCSASVWVVGRVPGKSRRYSVKQEYSATDNYNPARAWIIAILKALIAQEDDA